jgi:hypothetical protein
MHNMKKVKFARFCPSCGEEFKVVCACTSCGKHCCDRCSSDMLCLECFIQQNKKQEVKIYFEEKIAHAHL